MSDKQSPRDRALFLAMAALYEIANRADAGPIKPSLGLRALLAFLYVHSNGNKDPFVGFWRESRNPWEGHHQPGYIRATYTRTQWNGIAAATGFDRTPGYHHEIFKAVHGEEGKKPRGSDCG